MVTFDTSDIFIISPIMEPFGDLAAAMAALDTARKKAVREVTLKALDIIAKSTDVSANDLLTIWEYDPRVKLCDTLLDVPDNYALGPDFIIKHLAVSNKYVSVELEPLEAPHSMECIVDSTLAAAKASRAKNHQAAQDANTEKVRVMVKTMLSDIAKGKGKHNASGEWYKCLTHDDRQVIAFRKADFAKLGGNDYAVQYRSTRPCTSQCSGYHLVIVPSLFVTPNEFGYCDE